MNQRQLGRIETLLHLAAAWIEHEPQLLAAHLREHMKGQIRAAIADVEEARASAGPLHCGTCGCDWKDCRCTAADLE